MPTNQPTAESYSSVLFTISKPENPGEKERGRELPSVQAFVEIDGILPGDDLVFSCLGRFIRHFLFTARKTQLSAAEDKTLATRRRGREDRLLGDRPL